MKISKIHTICNPSIKNTRTASNIAFKGIKNAEKAKKLLLAEEPYKAEKRSKLIDGKYIYVPVSKTMLERLEDGSTRHYRCTSPYGSDDKQAESFPFKEILVGKSYREWQDYKYDYKYGNKSERKLKREILADGTEKEWKEDSLMYESYPDGSFKRWDTSGKLKLEGLPDGSFTYYHLDGTKTTGNFNESAKKRWNSRDFLKEEKNANNKTIRNWSDDGTLLGVYNPDNKNEYKEWYHSGKPKAESNDEATRKWNPQGELRYEKTKDAEREWFRNGTLIKEVLANGVSKYWDEDGNLATEITSDGTIKNYNIKGILVEEIFANGTRKEYTEKGVYTHIFEPHEPGTVNPEDYKKRLAQYPNYCDRCYDLHEYDNEREDEDYY